jgi:hypothetical protein
MAEEWKRQLEVPPHLEARVSFSPGAAGFTTANSFCSTVANAFAKLDPDFKAHVDQFTARPGWQRLPIEGQFEGLLANPLRKIKRRAILTINALNECYNEDRSRDRLLKILGEKQYSILLRIFVTGRLKEEIKYIPEEWEQMDDIKYMPEEWRRKKEPRVQLVARVSFSPGATGFTTANSFCSTVADAFAQLDPDFEAHMNQFTARSGWRLLSFKEQFDGLVANPLRKIEQRANLIIDALDQCHNKDASRDRLLKILGNQQKSIPLLRIFVTGPLGEDIKHIAEEWKQKQSPPSRPRLVARFFFSRDTAETMSINSFCSTVANAFSLLDKDFKAHMDKFANRPDLPLLSFEEQFEGLVAGPLRKVIRPAILTIDALDECNNEHGGRDRLLNAFLDKHSSIPLLRVLATGRPERDIKAWAVGEAKVGYANFTGLEGLNKDVELYIKSRLQELPRRVQYRLYSVITRAEGLFIWARIACDLLLAANDVEALLEALGKEVSLDYLYKVALEQSIPKDRSSQRAVVMALQMILAAKEPLSIADLEKLSPRPDIMEPTITRLGSLLVYEGRKEPVRLLHTTFREFLTGKSRAGIYFIQLELGHYNLASGCLRIITYASKQRNLNISRLGPSSQRLEIPVSRARFADYASRTFAYSSNSWVHHCTRSYRKLGLNEAILTFAANELGAWLELVNKWPGLELTSCGRYVSSLCRQNMVSGFMLLISVFTRPKSPEISKIMVHHGLKKVCGCSATYYLR